MIPNLNRVAGVKKTSTDEMMLNRKSKKKLKYKVELTTTQLAAISENSLFMWTENELKEYIVKSTGKPCILKSKKSLYNTLKKLITDARSKMESNDAPPVEYSSTSRQVFDTPKQVTGYTIKARQDFSQPDRNSKETCSTESEEPENRGTVSVRLFGVDQESMTNEISDPIMDEASKDWCHEWQRHVDEVSSSSETS